MTQLRGTSGEPPRGSDAGGMEHRWKVYIVRTHPGYADDWTVVTAESRTEAKEKVAASIARRTGEWRLADREAEMVA